jgi:hypothetical protein
MPCKRAFNVFWDVILYNVVEKSASYVLVECSAYSLTLKTSVLQSPETSVNFYQTTQCHILEILFFIVIAVRTSNPTNPIASLSV